MEDLLQCCVCGAVFNQTKVYLEDEDHQYNVPPFFFLLLLFALPQKKEPEKPVEFWVLRLQPWKRAASWKSAKRWWFWGHFGGVSFGDFGCPKFGRFFFCIKNSKKKIDMYQEIDLK